MNNNYDSILRDFISTNPSESRDAVMIDAIESEHGVALPDDYREFLTNFGGCEGFLGKHYLVLWNADQIVPYNVDYETNKYAPGLLLFGSNGAGEGFAFDLGKDCSNVVVVPFIGMCINDAKRIASSFTEFLQKLGQRDTELF